MDIKGSINFLKLVAKYSLREFIDQAWDIGTMAVEAGCFEEWADKLWKAIGENNEKVLQV